jgi:putative addiction module component (TIGR02574 family)
MRFVDLSLEQLESLSRTLPAEERERLAKRLYDSVCNQELSATDESWLSVAEQRFERYESGEERAVSSDTFFREIEDELGWK